MAEPRFRTAAGKQAWAAMNKAAAEIEQWSPQRRMLAGLPAKKERVMRFGIGGRMPVKQQNKQRKKAWLLTLTKDLLWQACKYEFTPQPDALALRIARHAVRERAARNRPRTALDYFPAYRIESFLHGNPFYLWNHADHSKGASASNLAKYLRTERQFLRSLDANRLYASRQYHAIERLRRRLIQKAWSAPQVENEAVQRNINELLLEERNRQIAALHDKDWDIVARVNYYEHAVYLGREPAELKATLRLLTALELVQLVWAINGDRYYRPTSEAYYRLRMMGRPLPVPDNGQPMPNVV